MEAFGHPAGLKAELLLIFSFPRQRGEGRLQADERSLFMQTGKPLK